MNPLIVNSRQIHQRGMESEGDYWDIHTLLAATYPITPLGFNWNVRRWEGSRFYDSATTWPSAQLAENVQLWVTDAGAVVGAVIAEGGGEAYLQVHPNFRTLESTMIAWAEEQLAQKEEDGQHHLSFFAFDYDLVRQDLLTDHGFRKTEAVGVSRRLQLIDYDVTVPSLAAGYTMRSTEAAPSQDGQRIADLLNAAFQRDVHNALEYENFAKLAPSFQRDLDLVAVAPDGNFAAYVGIPYDEENRVGIFEPVCTHPDHRRRGLARSLMLEGIRRLRQHGAREVIVETGNMIPANRLYEGLGFTECCRGAMWRKDLQR